MKLADVRRIALALPEVTEEPHFEKSSFRVRGKIFATVPEDRKHVHLHVDTDERVALIEEHPAAFEPIVWGKKIKVDWVRVNLAAADRDQLGELLIEAWRAKAPKSVVAAYESQAREH